MKKTSTLRTLALALAFTGTQFVTRAAEPVAPAVSATDDAAELAKKLSNPVASLISVPFQNNFDFGGGPNDDGFRYTLNVQPVVPFQISTNWNLITRTIIPFIHQEDMIGQSSQTGLGDIAQTFFLSPAKPSSLIWGAGPVLLYPSATDDLLGFEKFGVGPSVVALKQSHGWTAWTLANHVWSVAGDGSRDDVSLTYLNPGLSYQTKSLTTFIVQAEPAYDWKHEQWTVPVEAGFSQLLKIGKLPVSLSLQARYFAEKPSGGPDWGLRFVATFVFPK